MAQTPEDDRIAERRREWWTLYVRGRSQQSIADEYHVSQQLVSQGLRDYRATLPETERDQVRQQHVEQLMGITQELYVLVDRDPVPAYSYGKAMTAPDPDDPEGEPVPVWDHTGRLAAMDRLIKVQERMAKLLGLDAPTKTDATVTHEMTPELAEKLAAARRALGQG